MEPIYCLDAWQEIRNKEYANEPTDHSADSFLFLTCIFSSINHKSDQSGPRQTAMQPSHDTTRGLVEVAEL